GCPRLAMAASAYLALATLLGCSGSGQGPSPMTTAAPAVMPSLPPTPPPIEHVVIVIQENRSFDNLFQGYPGADTASSGITSTGQTVALRPVSLRAPSDIIHQL